jgi:two-component system, LytTR family, sensor kinase
MNDANTHLRTIGVFVLTMFMLSFVYYFTLHITTMEFEETEFWSIKTFFKRSGLDYLIRILIAIPTYYLLFIKLKEKTLIQRLPIHFVLACVFVIGGTFTTYAIKDALSWGRLRGYGSAWDFFIPALVYFSAFGFLHAWEHYEVSKHQIKVQAELIQNKLKAEVNALKSSLNPHFLYNTFNSINSTIPPEAEQTREMIADLADLLRYQMDFTSNERITIKEDLQFIRKYLDLEKIRLGDRLKYEIRTDDKINELKILPMLLQPLVENAIIHGISPSIKGGLVIVSVLHNKDSVDFTIENSNLDGMKSNTTGTGKGLSTVTKLLDLQYNQKLDYKISENNHCIVKFSIPQLLCK